MPYMIFALMLLLSSPSWANESSATNMQPVFENPAIDMTYPSVAGDYVVYSQRVNHTFQIMRLKKVNMYGSAKDVSPIADKEVVRSGVALANGDIAYTSNRLGIITPWLAQSNRNTSMATGAFQNLLIPHHLEVSDNGESWAFDSSLEPTRQSRLNNLFTDAYEHHQLLGQSWRIYHDKYMAYKSSYPASKSGLENKLGLPYIFTLSNNSSNLNMLSDGFDASLSADGQSMVFVREDNGNFDLWQQNIDGSNLKRLTKNTFADLEPALSPDGKRVVFISNRDAAGDILQTSIYTLEIATGKIAHITDGSGVTDGGPAWLDDQTIIFHSNRDPNAPSTQTVDNWRLWTVTLPQ